MPELVTHIPLYKGPNEDGSQALPTLVATDLVVMTLSRNSSGSAAFTLGGSAMPAVALRQLGTGATRVECYAKTGLVGAHSIAYNLSLSTTNHYMDIYVLRDLASPSAVAQEYAGFDNVTVSPNTPISHPAMAADNGQFVLQLAAAGNGAASYTYTPAPSSGWTEDRALGASVARASVLRRLLTGPATIDATLEATSNATLGVWSLVFGAAIAPTTPPVSGWGIPI